MSPEVKKKVDINTELENVSVNFSKLNYLYKRPGHRSFLRHLRFVFKLSYLDKTYIRYLRDKLTENNCKICS